MIGPHPRRDQPTPSSRGGKSDKPTEGATCPGCGEDICPGHSRQTFEGVSYCTFCAPLLPIVLVSVKELTTKNGIAPTAIEIYDHMASNGVRPPKKVFISSMLRILGFEENDGRWMMISSAEDGDAKAEKADA